MLHAVPELLNAPVVLVSEPWFAILFFAFVASLPRVLSWLFPAPDLKAAK